MRLSIVFFSSRTSSGEPLSPLLLLPPAGFDRSVAFSLRSRSISPLFFFLAEILERQCSSLLVL
jgi:hypothetical protein